MLTCVVGRDDRMAAEFSRRTEILLNRAEAICEHRGANLTELRRHVLGMILDAASPTGPTNCSTGCARRAAVLRRPPSTGRSTSCWSRG